MSDPRPLREQVIFPRAVAVSSETLQGEAIIINHENGSYFNSVGVGGFLWAMIEKGASRAELQDGLVGRYDVEPAQAAASIETFIAQLTIDALIEFKTVTVPPFAWPATEQREPFSPPVMERHSDLNDLLMLDPIHEVEPEAGWPVRL